MFNYSCNCFILLLTLWFKQKTNYLGELSRNGVYELFSAFRHNELDYRAFYPTIENERTSLVMDDIKSHPAGIAFTEKTAVSPGVNKSPNVILVIMIWAARETTIYP